MAFNLIARASNPIAVFPTFQSQCVRPRPCVEPLQKLPLMPCCMDVSRHRAVLTNIFSFRYKGNSQIQQHSASFYKRIVSFASLVLLWRRCLRERVLPEFLAAASKMSRSVSFRVQCSLCKELILHAPKLVTKVIQRYPARKDRPIRKKRHRKNTPWV